MKILFKIIFLLCLTVVPVAAQEAALPVITETEAITDLRPLARAAKENKKPLLVNFWATWCGPCRYEFPELVRIDAEYRSKGLDFAVVSLDHRGAIDYPVADFLRVYRSTMPSYLLDLPSPVERDRAIRQIAPRSRGGLPLTLLFNAKGKLVYQKAGVIDPLILKSKIEGLLTSKSRAEKVK